MSISKDALVLEYTRLAKECGEIITYPDTPNLERKAEIYARMNEIRALLGMDEPNLFKATDVTQGFRSAMRGKEE